ncbi:SMP-30/gluconolactonase/LRE family protein [Pararhodobacter zhoushanensis]|uniref:SMP-30/gluconolactonase/LRE family protein n=1 Tax=Pararhodobacter zhoushanensis TaxID=2479545 RepID=UPI000F8D43B3|nr:SMP-30/gluconolactonase/LRE family protein [Pararhodobacter zhoushanensis]
MPEQAQKRLADSLTATRLSERPAALGESPVWDAEGGCLWWIDGVAGEIRCHHPTRPEAEAVRIGGHIGSLALAEAGQLLVARDHAFLLVDPTAGAAQILLTLAGADPAMRLNDGATDRQGRFLCVGMGRSGAPLGAVHQLSADGRQRILASGIRIGNGVCFSPDGATLYFTDTPARKTYACDYDPASGEASEPRVLADTAPLGSGVDGQTVDRDGNLWAAMIHSAEIGCFAPDGRLLHRFKAPVDLPSSLAFGGADSGTLFVTSIRDSGTGRAVSKHPDGGHLFAIDGTGATGIPETRFPARISL